MVQGGASLAGLACMHTIKAVRRSQGSILSSYGCRSLLSVNTPLVQTLPCCCVLSLPRIGCMRSLPFMAPSFVTDGRFCRGATWQPGSNIPEHATRRKEAQKKERPSAHLLSVSLLFVVFNPAQPKNHPHPSSTQQHSTLSSPCPVQSPPSQPLSFVPFVLGGTHPLSSSISSSSPSLPPPLCSCSSPSLLRTSSSSLSSSSSFSSTSTTRPFLRC